MQKETSEETTGRGDPSPAGVLQFKDSKGFLWRVSERERLRYDRRSEKTLIFESSMAVRCVRTYPNDWRDLAPETLESLSWQT